MENVEANIKNLMEKIEKYEKRIIELELINTCKYCYKIAKLQTCYECTNNICNNCYGINEQKNFRGEIINRVHYCKCFNNNFIYHGK